MTKYTNNQDENEMSLKEIILASKKWISFLVSKWIIVLGFGLLGAAVGFYYATTKIPIYTATTTFVLEDEKSGGGLGNLAGLASMAGVDLGAGGGGIFQGDNILGLYKSRTMLEQTLMSKSKFDGREELLVERYIKFNNLKERWVKDSSLLNIKFELDSATEGVKFLKPDRLRDSLLGAIVIDLNSNYLNVNKPDKKLSTIQVDVRAPDELFAKAFNDALVKNVNEFYINTKTKKTLVNVQILQRKTDSVRRVMNGEIYSAVAVADATPNLNPTRQIQRVAPAQRAQFSAETNKAVLGELVKNLEMTKMALLKETPLIQVIDTPIFPLKRQKFSKAKGLILGCIAFTIFSMIGVLLIKIYHDASE
ncbi:MAG: lipopolysaccharide biosynthesis protein [Pedobacter sp.]|nr:MAG: lipopolysaccharide biosynthesis protein [Pedobacter sp.]